jgi:hypothetical protein
MVMYTAKKNMSIPWLLFISLCIHAFLRAFRRTSWGQPSHRNRHTSLPIAIILTIFSLTHSSTPKLFLLLWSPLRSWRH